MVLWWLERQHWLKVHSPLACGGVHASILQRWCLVICHASGSLAPLVCGMSGVCGGRLVNPQSQSHLGPPFTGMDGAPCTCGSDLCSPEGIFGRCLGPILFRFSCVHEMSGVGGFLYISIGDGRFHVGGLMNLGPVVS